jgi:hypothetical protein
MRNIVLVSLVLVLPSLGACALDKSNLGVLDASIGGSGGPGGSGNVAGGAGGGGRAGSQGAGGMGTTGSGGQPGSGAAGRPGSPGAGPCAGLCTNPKGIAPNTSSGDLGIDAVCDEVAGEGGIDKIVCGNFVAPRTFSVNGTAFDCVTGNGGDLPAPRNGGFCMQASAGQDSYAYFTTFQ